MRKTISLISAAALALATVTWSASTPIRADVHDSNVRMYFRIPLGGENGKSLLERSQYGFQYSRDLDFANFGTDIFNNEKPIVDMKFNFSDNTLKSANVFGLDAGAAYEVLTGQPIYRASDTQATQIPTFAQDPGFWFLVGAMGALAGIFVIPKFWDDDNGPRTNAEG